MPTHSLNHPQPSRSCIDSEADPTQPSQRSQHTCVQDYSCRGLHDSTLSINIVTKDSRSTVSLLIQIFGVELITIIWEVQLEMVEGFAVSSATSLLMSHSWHSTSGHSRTWWLVNKHWLSPGYSQVSAHGYQQEVMRECFHTALHRLSEDSVRPTLQDVTYVKKSQHLKISGSYLVTADGQDRTTLSTRITRPFPVPFCKIYNCRPLNTCVA